MRRLCVLLDTHVSSQFFVPTSFLSAEPTVLQHTTDVIQWRHFPPPDPYCTAYYPHPIDTFVTVHKRASCRSRPIDLLPRWVLYESPNLPLHANIRHWQPPMKIFAGAIWSINRGLEA